MLTFRRIVLRLTVACAILYAAILIALVNLENRLVYPGAYTPPTRTQPTSTNSFVSEANSGNKAQRELDPGKNLPDPIHSIDPLSDRPALDHSIQTNQISDVAYRTCDGILLWGRLLEAEEPNKTSTKNVVLVLHGNANRAVYMDQRLRRLAYWLDANVMAAEYRGFEDDHQPSEQGLQDDCVAAMDFLCSRYRISPTDVTIFGTSLGGGCATALAARMGAKAVILDRTFDRLVDVAADRYPIFPVRSIMKNRFDSISHLKKYRGPLIMIHGDRDEVVSIERGRNLFELAACSPKFWIEVPQLSHMMQLSDKTLAMMQEKYQEIERLKPSFPSSPILDVDESGELGHEAKQSSNDRYLNNVAEDGYQTNASQEPQSNTGNE